MTPDLINASFEFIGAAFTAANAKRVIADKGYAGIYLPAIVFFMSWGVWNLFYYPSLGQVFSFIAGICLVCANLTWIASMLVYGKKR